MTHAAGAAADRAAADRAAPDRAARRWVVPAVGLLALAGRLIPVLTAGTLRGVHGYDDGVHLAVAQRLLAGIVPYRDEIFLHPPGIAVALAPFAALADPLGDSWSLALARLLFIGLGAVSAMLVARVLAPRGTLAAAVGGGAYALWGAAVAAEHTVYLEGPIGIGLLIALGALRRAGPGSAAGSRVVTRALARSGLAIGLAVTFKIWVAIDALVLGALVLSRWGPRTLARWIAWCVLGAALLLAPFLALAPGQLWHDVVVVQGGRPGQDKPLAGRLEALDPTAALHQVMGAPVAVAVGVLLLLAVLAPLLARRRVAPSAWSDPVWWGVLAALQLVALAAAPSFYVHYVAFVAPALCLLLGAGAGRLASSGAWARMSRAGVPSHAPGGRRLSAGPAVVAVVAIAAGVGLVLARSPLATDGRVDNATLADFTARHSCVWTRNPSYLQVADAAARQLRAGCPSSPDIVGAWLVLGGGGSVPGSSARTLDALVLEELRGSDGAILSAHFPTQDLGARSETYLRRHFTRATTAGSLELWSRHR